jgi:hypothetical protein
VDVPGEVMMPDVPDRRFPETEIPDWWPYAAEFPNWHVSRGTDQLYHARLALTDVTARGEDPEDLRDMIIRAIGKLRHK